MIEVVEEEEKEEVKKKEKLPLTSAKQQLAIWDNSTHEEIRVQHTEVY